MTPKFTNKQYGSLLEEAMVKADADYKNARQDFNLSIAHAGTAFLPTAGIVAQIQLAGRQVIHALVVNQIAIDKHREFLLHGTIPGDQPISS